MKLEVYSTEFNWKVNILRGVQIITTFIGLYKVEFAHYEVFIMNKIFHAVFNYKLT